MNPHPICNSCGKDWTEAHKCKLRSGGKKRNPIIPPTEIEASLADEQITALVLRYGPLIQRSSAEALCSVAACPDCDADIDQGCVGQYGARSTTSIHADRRTVAETWRKANPQEWAALKADWFRHLVRMRRAGEI